MNSSKIRIRIRKSFLQSAIIVIAADLFLYFYKQNNGAPNVGSIFCIFMSPIIFLGLVFFGYRKAKEGFYLIDPIGMNYEDKQIISWQEVGKIKIDSYLFDTYISIYAEEALEILTWTKNERNILLQHLIKYTKEDVSNHIKEVIERKLGDLEFRNIEYSNLNNEGWRVDEIIDRHKNKLVVSLTLILIFVLEFDTIKFFIRKLIP